MKNLFMKEATPELVNKVRIRPERDEGALLLFAKGDGYQAGYLYATISRRRGVWPLIMNKALSADRENDTDISLFALQSAEKHAF